MENTCPKETVQFCQSIELSQKCKEVIESTVMTSRKENSTAVFNANIKSVNQHQPMKSKANKTYNKLIVNFINNEGNE